MNYKHSLHELFYAQGMGRAAARGKTASLRIGLAALVLVTLAAYLALSGPALVAHAAPPDTHTDYAFLAANPELLAARSYTAAALDAVAPAFLAANPELLAAHWYSAAGMDTGAQAAFLAANPELLAAHWYSAAGMDTGAQAAFLAANPELLLARR